MKDAQPQAIFLKDYRAPDYWITKTDLNFDLQDDVTTVTSTLKIERNQKANESTKLVLSGQDMALVSVTLNGVVLQVGQFERDNESLTLSHLNETNTLICITQIEPQNNSSLEGLYRSGSMYCTQCEAEGFRKITYYLDRPDVMSEFTTTLNADKTKYPVLLSNGNLIDSGISDGGRHWATWHDPFKKPCYLFALVAGDLVNIDDNFTTMSGRDVLLRVFVEAKDKDKVDHALRSLKNAMKWDEEVYGREYDLDIFMIVAVDAFNMGAMENKGLNIFNTSCVLAKSETTTDAGFQRVEAVVAHEYFHNWSGNRVTCRDWFQLSLKEGFTVFRDAEFSSDMGSRTVKRVEDVSMLRTMQFAEDAGPMAHPVQPSSFIEISNFYTLTIYEKGSEVVRMIRTLLGEELFRKGSDLYFERHDGQAVTIDDFVAAMAAASGRDFTQFMLWYRQAGTPIVRASGKYDADQNLYTLTLTQSCPASPECLNKQPFHIPVAMGLLGEVGGLPLKLRQTGGADDSETSDNTHLVLEFTEATQRFVFENVMEAPVPSLFRGFSAPVKLHFSYRRDELMRLMSMDDDGFCRWDAAQQLAVQVIQEVMAGLVGDPAPSVDDRLIEAYGLLLNDKSLDPAMVALMLSLPSEAYLAELSTTVDVDLIHHARNRVERKIAQKLNAQFHLLYSTLNIEEAYSDDSAQVARRSLKNAALHYLVISGKDEAIKLCVEQFQRAENMTDELSALTEIVYSSKPSLEEVKEKLLVEFYEKWSAESLVVNSWFSVQCSSPAPGGLHRVKMLMQHPAFDIKNPNKLRAVIGAFTMRNPLHFHDAKGDGYAFLADQIIVLNVSNPQMASRLLTPLTKWKRYDGTRQQLMKNQLLRIKAQANLSKDVFEVLEKSLANS